MSMIATPDQPIHELLKRRWSPYAFSPTPLAEEDLLAILEAARWSPSSFNEQPWRYIVAPRTDSARFSKAHGCLLEGNQGWTANVGALLFGCYRKTFSRNDKPNRVAMHDLGAASMAMCVEASARGLYLHQMGGINAEAVRTTFGVPDNFEVCTGLAIGHRALEDDTSVDAALRERDQGDRARRPMAEFAFTGDWLGD